MTSSRRRYGFGRRCRRHSLARANGRRWRCGPAAVVRAAPVGDRHSCTDGGVLAGTGQRPLGRHRIAPVGLDPLAGLAWDQRWCDYRASVPGRSQLPLNAVTARAGLVAEPQTTPAMSQLCSQHIQRSWGIRDLAILAHIASHACLGKRHRYRILVHIQPGVGDSLFHDPSPMHEARHRTSGAILENLHTVRRVAPISGEHLV